MVRGQGKRTRRADTYLSLVIYSPLTQTLFTYSTARCRRPSAALPYSASCGYSISRPVVASSLPELSDERAVILPLRTQ